MGRYKKGCRQVTKDLWQRAGGQNTIVKSFIRNNFKGDIVTIDQWKSVAFSLFQSTATDYIKWLRVIWSEDRRGVQTEVLQTGRLQGKGANSEEPSEVDPPKKQDTYEEQGLTREEDKDSPQTQDQYREQGSTTEEDTDSPQKQDKYKEHGSTTEEDTDSPQKQDKYKEHGTTTEEDTDSPQKQDKYKEHGTNTEEDTDSPQKQDKYKEHGSTTEEDTDSPQKQDKYKEHGTNTEEDTDSPQKQDKYKEHGSTTEEDTDSPQKQDKYKEHGSTTEEDTDSPQETKAQTETRVCKAGPKVFKISITRKKWNKIKPSFGSNKLKPPWTDTFYDEFLKKNPCCTLAFKYQHVKMSHSRKKNSQFFRASAKCTFDGCKAVYSFSKKCRPSSRDKEVGFKVTRFGKIKHKKNQRRSRPAKYLRRGKIAKALSVGVSNYYYSLLRKTPVEEIMAGNITRSLTKDVLKKISSEIKKSKRLHNDMVLELLMTQKVMKESSSQVSSKGYLKHLQIDPFAVHLYTDMGMNILAEHLRRPSPTTLYLDATGGVVQKIPDQHKKVLYYALVLPGMGKDKPPLPVSELLTNSHSIPSISHWLMEFKRKLSYTTKRGISQVETDYSWALINSVLLAFNKENISAYLTRAFEIVSGKAKETPKFTVLHLCSAHIIKAVSQAFGKKTTDRGIQEFATFCFAYLLNCRSMQVAVEVFYHMCVLFDAEDCTHTVQQSKTYLDKCVLQTREIKLEETGDGMEDEESTSGKPAKSIVGKSPFTIVFQVQRDQAECDFLSDDATGIKNPYLCPSVIDVLLKHYMGICPLWSGLMLGNLSRHGKENPSKTDSGDKTRDTNCHVELWFGLVKHSILQKKKHLRPAEFISKLFGSMQGRYVEHISQHNLPMQILHRGILSSKKPADDHEESWKKRDSSADQLKSKSKYFNPPKKMPKPKSPRKGKKDHQDKDAQLTSLWKKESTEVVVAVLPLQIKGQSIVLHHSELCSLRPHQWLIGEAIEALFHVAAHRYGVEETIYIMNHYTSGVILFGDRTDLPRFSLRKVNFENYEAVLSFVLVNNNHWKLLFINAQNSTVYVMDPIGSSELKDSQDAAKRIKEYFRMRRTCHGKTDWVDVKWKGGDIRHPLQQDGSSCGVIVIKMANALMEAFPGIPTMAFETSKSAMKRERKKMALQLLEASVFDEQSHCAMCASVRPPGSGPQITDWVQCDSCGRWYHKECLEMDNRAYKKIKEKSWMCPLCK